MIDCALQVAYMLDEGTFSDELSNVVMEVHIDRKYTYTEYKKRSKEERRPRPGRHGYPTLRWRLSAMIPQSPQTSRLCWCYTEDCARACSRVRVVCFRAMRRCDEVYRRKDASSKSGSVETVQIMVIH